MKVRLSRYTGSKIDAIKCVRNAVGGLDLFMGKNLVERLPLEIEVIPERVEELRSNFEFQVSGGSDTMKLFATWKALSQNRQAELLQYLAGMGMLHTGAIKAGGDVDFENGADALAVVPDDGSGSVRS